MLAVHKVFLRCDMSLVFHKIENGDIYEYDIHHNHYYGTSKKLINDKARDGIVIKDIDVNRN